MPQSSPDTSYILVDANGTPVPLPFHTPDGRCISNFFDPDPDNPFGMEGSVWIANGQEERPSAHGLRLITEAEFMAAQAARASFEEDHSVHQRADRSIKHSYTGEGKNYVD